MFGEIVGFGEWKWGVRACVSVRVHVCVSRQAFFV